MYDTNIEQDIKAAGVDKFPRITPEHIEACIKSERYLNVGYALKQTGWACVTPDDPTNLLTFCVLALKNGFTVTGESACASLENFNAAIGQKIARQNAVQKIWQLEGYLLREKLTYSKGE